MKKQTNKLPKAFKKKWVAALRSGKYKQGKHRLKQTDIKGDSYCCLGVACEIANSKNIQGNYIVGNISKNNNIPKLIKGNSENSIVAKLTQLNDGEISSGDNSKSFKYIASYIERYL